MFIEQAYKGNNEWWRVLLTTTMTAGFFVLNIILFLVLYFYFPEKLKLVYELSKGEGGIGTLIVNLIPFAFFLFLLFLFVVKLHERSILSLTTSRDKIDYKRVLFSFLLIVSITSLSFIASYYNDNSSIILIFNPLKFTLLFVVCIILLPFQIGCEEYLFRGYLMQQIGIVARNRWFPLLTTSIMFGLLHSANPEVAEMGFGIMAFYIGTGLLLGIMTLMDDGIELALGFHFGNNLMAAILITSDFAALQTDAIFKYTEKQNSANLLNETILSILIIYPILLFILSKKYGWTNWKEKLTGKIQNIENESNNL